MPPDFLSISIVGASSQTALERQELSCAYLAHHDLESVIIIIYYS